MQMINYGYEFKRRIRNKLRTFSPVADVASGALKMTDMKLQDMKLTDRVAGHEIAGHENGGPNSRT